MYITVDIAKRVSGLTVKNLSEYARFRYGRQRSGTEMVEMIVGIGDATLEK
jgi:hypothetical protein